LPAERRSAGTTAPIWPRRRARQGSRGLRRARPGHRAVPRSSGRAASPGAVGWRSPGTGVTSAPAPAPLWTRAARRLPTARSVACLRGSAYTGPRPLQRRGCPTWTCCPGAPRLTRSTGPQPLKFFLCGVRRIDGGASVRDPPRGGGGPARRSADARGRRLSAL